MKASIALLVPGLFLASPAWAYPPLPWHTHPVDSMQEAVRDGNLRRLRGALFASARARYGNQDGLNDLSHRIHGRSFAATGVVYGARGPGRMARYRRVWLCAAEEGREDLGCAMQVALWCWRQARGGRHCLISGVEFPD